MIILMSVEERTNRKMNAAKSISESERMGPKYSCTKRNITPVSAILTKNSSGISALASMLVDLKMAAEIKTPAVKLNTAREYEIAMA